MRRNISDHCDGGDVFVLFYLFVSVHNFYNLSLCMFVCFFQCLSMSVSLFSMFFSAVLCLSVLSFLICKLFCCFSVFICDYLCVSVFLCVSLCFFAFLCDSLCFYAEGVVVGFQIFAWAPN